jgi:transcriptional regulator with XRE-family HTH domain
MAVANAPTPLAASMALLSACIRPAYHGRDSSVNTSVSDASGKTAPVDTLPSRLKAARDAKGLSQPELARRAGVAQSTVGNIESGIRAGAQSLAALAIALEVRYQWLRDGELPMRQAIEPMAWPFRYINPEEWGRLQPHERAAMEEAALEKLREIRSGVSRIAALQQPARAPDFDALGQAIGSFGQAVKAQVLGLAGSKTGAEQATGRAIKKLFAAAGVEWPSARPLPQALPADSPTP